MSFDFATAAAAGLRVPLPYLDRDCSGGVQPILFILSTLYGITYGLAYVLSCCPTKLILLSLYW